jgi:hypothetical protein
MEQGSLAVSHPMLESRQRIHLDVSHGIHGLP